jgi:alkanesulfonate monooxygenase SsuD/methylene tetrahydromethanopterin reductase-like flavin-dependent oxidoreductase (luciferase family)
LPIWLGVGGTPESLVRAGLLGLPLLVTIIGGERGWPEVTRVGFDAQRDPQGALLIGDPDEVVEKIVRHSKTLGGISRITFMMNAASLPHVKLM